MNRDNISISIGVLSLTLVIIVLLNIITINGSINYFNASTIHLAYSQSNQHNSSGTNINNTNSVSIQNMPPKKVHVGDIDIAYKIFGKGKPLLLIAGSGANMDMWDPTVLKQLSICQLCQSLA